MMHRWLVVAAVTGFVSACSGASRGTTPPRAENGPEVCANRPMFGPVQLDRAAAKRRYGASAKYLGDAPTSQQHAVEVCGTGGQIEWLTRVTCANGSSPFPSGAAAHQARSGSVGAGGKCGSIIDLYTVTCPEATYTVHLDMYMCGPLESMWPQRGGQREPGETVAA